MLLQYGLLKDKQIMGHKITRCFNFLFYELFFTIITPRVGRWKLILGLKEGNQGACSLGSEADVR